MTQLRLVPILTGFLASALTACGGTEPDPNGNGGNGGEGGAPAVCDTDVTRLSTHAPVSLKTDIMPIFGNSCVQSQCHDSDRPQATMYLGPKCSITNLETRVCEYPADMPLTQAEIDMVHANLIVASKTVPTVMRVAANDPLHSLLIQKTADIHLEQGHVCVQQSTDVTNPCGEEMPPDVTLCTQKNGQERWDKIAAWILQGALNN